VEISLYVIQRCKNIIPEVAINSDFITISGIRRVKDVNNEHTDPAASSPAYEAGD
jgi:hypothetical protein